MYLVFDVCAEHTKQSVEQLFGEFLIRQAGLAFDVTATGSLLATKNFLIQIIYQRN